MTEILVDPSAWTLPSVSPVSILDELQPLEQSRPLLCLQQLNALRSVFPDTNQVTEVMKRVVHIHSLVTFDKSLQTADSLNLRSALQRLDNMLTKLRNESDLSSFDDQKVDA